MRNNEIKKIAFSAILMALVVLFSLFYFFQLPVFAVVTIAHIPVLVGAIILGPKHGAALGFVFGLTSLVIASFVMGNNAPFTNPLLSILPRVFFGWVTYYVYVGFKNLIKERYTSIVLTMIISTLIHSLVVLPILYFVTETGFFFTAKENPLTTNTDLLTFIITILGANSVLEIVVAAIVGPAIILVLDKLNAFNE